MAVRHMAWLKFKEGVDTARIDHHLQACRSMVGRVAAVLDLECGTNISDRAGGFTHGIIVSVDSPEGLAAYMSDPVHLPIADALKADVAELRVMDIEF